MSLAAAVKSLRDAISGRNHWIVFIYDNRVRQRIYEFGSKAKPKSDGVSVTAFPPGVFESIVGERLDVLTFPMEKYTPQEICGNFLFCSYQDGMDKLFMWFTGDDAKQMTALHVEIMTMTGADEVLSPAHRARTINVSVN